MSLPHFPFYASDWLAGTIDLLAEERGALVQLLALCWDRDGLPDDPQRLAVMAGVPELPAVVLEKFPVADDGKRRNPRLEKIRTEATRLHAARVERARAGGLAKAAAGRQGEIDSTSSLPKAAPKKLASSAKRVLKAANQNQNQTVSDDTENSPLAPQGGIGKAPGRKAMTALPDFPEDFQRLWNAGAPESRARSGLLEAFKAWSESGASSDPERAIAAISGMAQSKGWKEGFAPGLHRWLKQGGWMDIQVQEATKGILATSGTLMPASIAKNTWGRDDD